MKPKADPTSDSLVSGINPPTTAVSAPPTDVPAIPQEPIDLPANPQTQTVSSFQNPAIPVDTTQPTMSGITNDISQTRPLQSPTSVIDTASNIAVSTPDPIMPQPPIFQQPTATQTQAVPQNTSPYDPPPAPAQVAQPVINSVDLGSKVVNDKPKKKVPVFLLILLLLVAIVLGAVGFLAYQNFNLNKNISTNQIQQTSLEIPEVKDPYLGYVKYQSSILPVEFMLPSGWKVDESQDTDLANQKMITARSSDFLYEAGIIARGFEFRIGPVNDLSKKYTSFDAFSAEENAENSFVLQIIGSKEWLVKGVEAKTLIGTTPVTIALYSNESDSVTAVEVFNKILNSIRVLSASPTPEASPSAGITQ